jgi:hypothetical protein
MDIVFEIPTDTHRLSRGADSLGEATLGESEFHARNLRVHMRTGTGTCRDVATFVPLRLDRRLPCSREKEGKTMSVDDTQEKLWQAVQTALVGAGNIQERLRSAAMYLIRVQATESAFPARADLQRRLEAILRELTGSPATGRGGTLESSIAALKDDDAKRVAVEILSLLCEATRLARRPVGVTPS